jgi:hypothetical protein
VANSQHTTQRTLAAGPHGAVSCSTAGSRPHPPALVPNPALVEIVQFIDTRLNAEAGLVVCGCAGMTTGVEAATSVAGGD